MGRDNIQEKTENAFEDKKSVFGYIAQLLATYGAMVVIFIVFDICIGRSTEGYSTLFELGSRGLTVNTLLQLLLLAVLVTIAQVVFLTDVLIKNMNMIARNFLFIIAIFVSIVVFAVSFGWFPVNDLAAWVGFLVSFSLSMAASLLITRFIEKSENKKMQEALDKYMEKRNEK
ncbi:MAG: hypothetical protein J6T50_05290 [Lachnospiraceae bacterium]|nr:hypothetical protein [Lachnospiraceae bacterium]